MVEVIGSQQEINGIKELEEMSSSFKELLSNVLVAAEGCSNTEELTERLLVVMLQYINYKSYKELE